MSPTINVCSECGEKLPLIKDDQLSTRSKTNTSHTSQRHRACTVNKTYCQACRIYKRSATMAQCYCMPKTSQSILKNDTATLANFGSGKVSKKVKRSRWYKVKRQEYKKLRKMLPSLQQKEKVSKLELIEEAIRYIEELHSALVKRFKDRGFPPILKGLNISPHEIDGDSIRDLIRKLLANAKPGSLPPTRIENIRTTPSFMFKLIKNKKS